jgi:hypothetical protein
MPIKRNIMIVLIGILSTNNEIPKHKTAIPRIESQRVVISMLFGILYYFILRFIAVYIILNDKDENYAQ